MTTLTNNDRPTAFATSGLSLRIAQPGSDDRIVPLLAGKCTVGSSERCQVHLVGATVRPLHCLIVHESAETTVIRWAPGALLNDQEFATAPFQAGDCLRIGDVQLLLISETSEADGSRFPSKQPPVSASTDAFACATPESTSSAFAPTTEPVERLVEELVAPELCPTSWPTGTQNESAATSLEVDSLVSRLKTSNQSARQRCRKLIRSLRMMQTEAKSSDQQISDLQQQLAFALSEREQIFSQLSQLQTEACEREGQSSEELDRLISELSTAYEKASTAEAALAEQVQQSQSELASLQGQREQWEQTREAGEVQRSKLAQALADREQAIEALQAEIEGLSESASQAETNCEEQATALEALQSELELSQTEREQLAAESRQLVEERDKLVANREEYLLSEQSWEQDLAGRDSQIEELTDEIEQLRLKVAEINQDTADQESQGEEFQQQLDALTIDRDQLIAAQVEQVEKIQEWQETVAARDGRIKELEEEHDVICQVLQSLEQGSFEQVDACTNLEKQLSTVRAERDQLSEGLSELQDYFKQLEQALAERDGQVALLSDELTRYANRQSELETELAKESSAHQALKAESADLGTRCEKLVDERSQSSEQAQDELNELLARHDELTTEHQAEIERRQKLEQQLAERQQATELFQVDLKSIQAELDRSVEQASSLQNERETLNQQLVELRDELAAREIIDDVSDPELKQQRDDLASELLLVRQQLEDLEQQTDVAGEDTNVSQQLVAQLEEEKSLLQQRVEQLDLQTEQLTADLEQARQHLQMAGQALQDRAEQQVATPDQTSVEPVEWPSSSVAVSLDSAEVEDFTISEPTDLDQVAEDTAEEFQPQSFIEQYRHMLGDSDEASSEPTQLEPAPTPVENRPEAELGDTQADSGGDSDEADLEAYMSSMLIRMRGESSDETAQPLVSSTTTSTQDPDPVAAEDGELNRVATEVEVVGEPHDDEPLDMEKLKQSSQMTTPIDITAMRELANTSARRAIAKHHKRRYLERSLGLFLVCPIAFCVGGYMLKIAIEAEAYQGFNFFGGIFAVLVGVFGGFRLLGLLLRVIRAGSWERKAAPKKPVEQEANS